MIDLRSFVFRMLLPAIACSPAFSLVAADPDPPSTETIRQSLQVRKGYRVDLVASEPLIQDPVSARLDFRGRLWVIEMPDYPSGPVDGNSPDGRIKILRDSNGDGRFDRATTFARGLLFPTGIQPYRDGAIVTLAGKIVRFRDTDGDDIADRTIELFAGFAQQNQQLRANHPTLGPDGLIYVAGGLRGGSIQSLHNDYQPRPEPVDLRDRDFCFDPEGAYWGAVAGKSQFGLTIDDFGRRIGCSNRNPAMMTPIDLDDVQRDPLLAARDAIHNIAAPAEKSKVVSLGEAWTTSNLHAGQFSAACGVTAPGFQDREGEWLAVCEPTAYLVQRQRLRRDGSVWTSNREAENDEFLASRNIWFRPVDLTPGAGQSLLVVDMGRAVIEHPDFMPTELKQRPDLRWGTDLGRIWRVMPADAKWKLPQIESADQAIIWLGSHSPWQRSMASRYLLETDQHILPQLDNLLKNEETSATGCARAALLLARHDALTTEHIDTMLHSQDARLRALAVELSSFDQLGSLETRLSDSDPIVQLALANLLVDADDQPEQRIDALATIAAATDDPWIQRTMGSAADTLIKPLAIKLTQRNASAELLSHLIQRIAIDSPGDAAAVVADIISSRSDFEAFAAEDADLLEAWISGLRRGRHSAAKVFTSLSGVTKEILTQSIERAGRAVLNDAQPPALRSRALGITSAIGQVPAGLDRLLSDQTPSAVRAAVIPVALQRDPETTREFLVRQLPGLPVPVRSAAITACSRSVENTLWLLEQIATGELPRTVIDPATADRLRKHSNKPIRKMASELLKSDGNRQRVVQQYAAAASSPGDAAQGKKLFAEHCSACHHIDGVGTNVGPDISDTRTKTFDALLVAILDPNAAIDSSFIQYRILTIDGRVLDGLLIDETADAVTLQQKGGERTTVPREEIERLQAPGISLMPEGFEQSIKVQEMAHLLSYLKNWRYLRTSIPGTLTQQ